MEGVARRDEDALQSSFECEKLLEVCGAREGVFAFNAERSDRDERAIR